MDITLDKKLQGIQLVAQEKLQAIICSIPGKKALILEPTLIKPLEHICTASWLKLKGIQHIYKYDATQGIPRSGDQVQIYMLHSDLTVFALLLQQLQQQLEHAAEHHLDNAFKHYHIVCVPSCFAYFQTLLEEEGLCGFVQLHRYNWDFLYLDQGVLSLEMRNVFGSLFLQKNTAPLPAIAQSLRLLQMIGGRPAVTLTWGTHAENLVKIMNTLSMDDVADATSQFGALIIIDRDKDYASGLLTPAIYAGLLLEVFQQNAGELSIERKTNRIRQQKLQIYQTSKPEATQKSNQPPIGKQIKPSVIRLNAQYDEIYGENRYRHFAQASSMVRAQAKAIGLELQKLNAMELQEMHEYVARKLPKITELKSKLLRHLNASEIVIEMMASNFRKVQTLEEDILNNVSRKRSLSEIDELLATDGQRYNTLRLLCLLHLSAGVASDELQQFVRNYCNLFGHQQLPMFQQLSKAGLLPELVSEDRGSKPAKLLSSLPISKFQQTKFQANANRLKLLVSNDDGEEKQENSGTTMMQPTPTPVSSCPSFVFNGVYIPLVAQLLKILLKSKSAEYFGTQLDMIDQLQMHIPSGSGSAQTTSLSIKNYIKRVKSAEISDIFPLKMRNLCVFVVGGVTYAEIGACDQISRDQGAQIIVTSDAIIAGSDLMAAAESC